jgi:hypothetical protein
MKKFLGILVLGLLWCSNANAAKGDGICGLQSNLFDKNLNNDSVFDELVNFLN